MRNSVASIIRSLVVMTVLSAGPLAAQALETEGAFYAVSVQHFDEMVAWYEEHLGFSVESRGENAQRRGALLVRPGAVLEIAAFGDAVSRSSVAPDLESHQVYGIFKLGFTVSDLDAAFRSLSDAGVEIFFPIVDAAGGRRTFGIRDPEGNIVQFFGE